MLHLPENGKKLFVVVVYNRIVRALVKENQSHWHFDDVWADAQVRDVSARDEEEALTLLAKKFPPEDGFVIAELRPSFM